MLRRHPLFQCTLALFTGAALVLTMSACDTVNSFSNSEDDPDVELGRFEMTLSGAVDTTLEGTAVFGTITEKDSTGEEHNAFGVAFMPDTAEAEAEYGIEFAAQIMRASTRPERGDHEFTSVAENHIDENALPAEAFVFGLQTQDASRRVLVTSDSGTLTLTTSSSSRIAGTFSVETSGIYYEPSAEGAPQTGSITVEGRFNAIGGKLPSQN